MDAIARLLTIIIVLMLTGGCLAMADGKFHAVTLVDRNNPVPAQWLRKAGIDYVYTSAALKMEQGPDGSPQVPGSEQAGWEKMAKEYAGTGIKVLIMSNYYAHNPAGAEAYDVAGRKLKMACLHQDKFYEWMREAIAAQTKAYGKYGIFGGFVFDDGWGTRVDACYCDTCKRLFKEQYGKEPPPFEVHEGVGVLPDDDTLLQWEQFQREAYNRYVKVQSEAVRSVSDNLLMVTIPSDSYFYGRLLNANMQREELPANAGALIQRIERLQVKNWFLYQSFPIPRLPEAGEEGLQPWGVGEHITANSPKLILSADGPFIQHYSRTQMMSPDEIAQMARITITEGGNAICYWVSGAYSIYHPTGYDGMADVHADVAKIEQMLMAREPHPAEVGLIYSTTTEVMEQPWKTNLSERWVHLHSFEGTAFALLRGNVWHRVVMEDEIADGALEGLRALIVPAARFLSRSAHEAIQQAAAAGMKVYTAGSCAPIAGAEAVDYDVTSWHRHIQAGYRQPKYLNAQHAQAEKDLLPRVRSAIAPPVAVSSVMGISKLYKVGDDLVLMIANWDLDAPAEATITATNAHSVADMLSGEELGGVGNGGKITATIEPAGWRVLRLRYNGAVQARALHSGRQERAREGRIGTATPAM